jgi:hypothetical protein
MNDWELKAGAVVLILTALGKLINDYRIDRRETRLAGEKAIRDEEAGRLRLEALQEIARSNSNIRDGQIEQNGKLATVVKVNEVYHSEMLRAMAQVCQARQLVNQQKKEQT